MWPTTDDPRTVFVTLRLTASEAADLDAYAAAEHGGNRSAAARHSVDRNLAAYKKRKAREKDGHD